MKGERDPSLDAVRGLAVCLMIAANLWPYLHQTPAFWLRIPLSMAAPIFFYLAGYFGIQQSKFPTKNILLGLSVGILTDVVVWQTVPSFSFDVLYSLMIAISLVYLSRSISALGLAGVSLAFALLSIVAFQIFPYQPAGFESKGWLHIPIDFSFKNWANQVFISGWFPILPWASIAFLGAWMFKNEKYRIWIGVGLISVGIILQKTIPHHFGYRRGYPELFHPMSVQFISIAGGSMLLIVEAMRRLPLKIKLLSLLGRHSLSVYLMHELLIVRVIDPLKLMTSMNSYVLVLAGLIGLSLLLSWGIERITSSPPRA